MANWFTDKLRHSGAPSIWTGWWATGYISWRPHERLLFLSPHGPDSSCSYIHSMQIRLCHSPLQTLDGLSRASREYSQLLSMSSRTLHNLTPTPFVGSSFVAVTSGLLLFPKPTVTFPASYSPLDLESPFSTSLPNESYSCFKTQLRCCLLGRSPPGSRRQSSFPSSLIGLLLWSPSGRTASMLTPRSPTRPEALWGQRWLIAPLPAQHGAW